MSWWSATRRIEFTSTPIIPLAGGPINTQSANNLVRVMDRELRLDDERTLRGKVSERRTP